MKEIQMLFARFLCLIATITASAVSAAVNGTTIKTSLPALRVGSVEGSKVLAEGKLVFSHVVSSDLNEPNVLSSKFLKKIRHRLCLTLEWETEYLVPIVKSISFTNELSFTYFYCSCFDTVTARQSNHTPMIPTKIHQTGRVIGAS